eukprot:EC716858.1.p1 GENE.EC716858.1~~EC716858.1.p1  ORF type:complete len:126 (+),score=2.37 EC716858.1:200-577(+)
MAKPARQTVRDQRARHKIGGQNQSDGRETGFSTNSGSTYTASLKSGIPDHIEIHERDHDEPVDRQTDEQIQSDIDDYEEIMYPGHPDTHVHDNSEENDPEVLKRVNENESEAQPAQYGLRGPRAG